MEALRDIKPLLEIPDMSYYLYLGFLGLIETIFMILLIIVVKNLWKNRKKDIRKVYFENLKILNWDNPKSAAYATTYLGRKLCNDDKSREIYKELVVMLEPYKYKKEVPKIDDKTLQQYNLLVHVLDESV
jgi:hypothetical protein